MFLLKCSSCGNTMKYQPKGGSVIGKKKRCVYCGKTFTVHSNPLKSSIVKEISK